MSRRPRAWWASWVQDVPASARPIDAAPWPPPAAIARPIDLDPADVIGLWSSADLTDAPVSALGARDPIYRRCVVTGLLVAQTRAIAESIIRRGWTPGLVRIRYCRRCDDGTTPIDQLRRLPSWSLWTRWDAGTAGAIRMAHRLTRRAE